MKLLWLLAILGGVAQAQIDPPVPHLIALCQGADSATAACIGEQVPCLARILNDTPDPWLLQSATVDGVVVRSEPLLMNPGTTFDAARIETAVETVPGFFEVSVEMTLDREDGALVDYQASLRPFLAVHPCARAERRVARRARRVATYRARCVNNDTLQVRVCKDTHGDTWTAPLQ